MLHEGGPRSDALDAFSLLQGRDPAEAARLIGRIAGEVGPLTCW